MTLLDLQKYLPFATVVAIAACVTLAGGIFRFAGTEWMGFLEFTDILAISWPAIPFVLVTLLGGTSVHVAVLPPRPGQSPPREGIPVPIRKAGFATKVAFVLGLTLVFTFFPMTTMIPSWLGALTFLWITLAFFLMVPGMATLPISPIAWSCVTAFMLLAFSYAYGVWTGSSGFIKRPDDVVVVSGEPHCVEVLLISRRGPIVIVGQAAAEFYPWDDVDRVSINSGCTAVPA